MLNELLELLIVAHNNTRMKENRGYKPSELARKMSIDKKPIITDVIPATVFPRGLNGESIHVEKKIYPNDPCPCGSGKKYKKCCGK